MRKQRSFAGSVGSVGSVGRVVAVAALALGVAACLPRLQQPEVTLSQVRIGSVGLQGGLLYVNLQVVNPNNFALQARSLTYDLALADVRGGTTGTGTAAAEPTWIDVATGELERPLRIEAGDTAHLEIPIEFTYLALGGAIRSVMERGTIDYRVRGNVAVERPLRRDVPYNRRGTVAVGGAPR
jgi:LEA14-like dessication related protein